MSTQWFGEYKYLIIPSGSSNFSVYDGDTGLIKITTGSLPNAVTYGINNLTSGRNWTETIVVKNTGSTAITLSSPIFIGNRSYVRLVVRGSFKAVDAISTFSHPSGSTYQPHLLWIESSNTIEVIGGHIDGNTTYFGGLSSGSANLRSICPVAISGSTNIKIRDMELSFFTGYGILCYDSDRIDLENNYIHDGWQAGIAVINFSQNRTGERIRVVGNRIKKNAQFAQDIYGASSPFETPNRNGVSIEGFFNAGQTSYFCPFRMGSVSYTRSWATHPFGVLIESSMIEDVGRQVFGSEGNGMSILSSFHVIAADNILINGTGEGIILTNAKSCIVADNEVVNCAINNVTGYNNGIRIDDAGVNDGAGQGSFENIIAGNRIRQHGTAIVERNLANRTLIHGNNYWFNTSTGSTIGSLTVAPDNIGG